MRKWWLIGLVLFLVVLIFFWPDIKNQLKLRIATRVVGTWTNSVQQLLTQQYLWRQQRPWTTWILSMISQESGGEPEATNPADPSYGLMAITPGLLKDFNRVNQKSYTIDNMFVPWKNLEVGVWFFDMLFHSYNGDYDKTVMAYNAGQGNIEAGRPHLERVKEYLSLIQPQFA
jgi:hypothetical protein